MDDTGARKLAAAVLLQAIKDLSQSYTIVRKGKPKKARGIPHKEYMEKMRKYNEAQKYVYELEHWFRSGRYSTFADAIDFDVDAETIIKKCKLGGYRIRTELRKF